MVIWLKRTKYIHHFDANLPLFYDIKKSFLNIEQAFYSHTLFNKLLKQRENQSDLNDQMWPGTLYWFESVNPVVNLSTEVFPVGLDYYCILCILVTKLV